MKKFICFFLLCFIQYYSSAETLIVTNINDSGTGSLRRMIEIANNGDSIIFDKSIVGRTIEVLSLIQTQNTLIINGGYNDSKITLSGRNENRILSGNFKLYNLTITKSKGSSVSGCSYVDNCIFENNYSTVSGAAIESSNILTISNSKFKNNISEVDGGAISYSSNLLNSSSTPSIIKNCTFENNNAKKSGGAISSSISCLYESSRGYMTVTDCIFKNNVAEESGGAIFFSASTSKLNTSAYNNLTATNCVFTENISTKNGGAIYSTWRQDPTIYTMATNTTLNNCTFENNKSAEIVNADNLTLTECLFRKNTGAGIYGRRVSLVTNCYFEENAGCAIGIILYSREKSVISDCMFVNNVGSKGGAILCDNINEGNLSLMNSTFKNNTAEKGGAICFQASYHGSVGTFSVTSCTFENNTAKMGGAIYSDDNGYSYINKSTFFNNSSDDGGALYNSNTISFKLKGNIFVNNKLAVDNILYDVKNGISEGYNVYTSNQNAVFSEPTDYRYTSSQNLLMSIGNYGGNTQTMPINENIVNWEDIVVRVPVADIPDIKTDQRGVLLPKNGMACAGSVEMNASEDATLSNITVSSGTLTPAFSSAIYNYTVTVGNSVNRITIKGTTNNSNSNINGEVNNMQLAMGDNVITLTIIAQSGNTQQYVITVKRSDNPTTDVSIMDKNSLIVYPNPTSDIIHFQLEEEKFVQLYDLLGRLVLSRKYEAGDIEMNIGQQSDGIYILKIDNQVIKIVKQ